MLIQNNSNCWIERIQFEIKVSSQYKFYDNIENFLIWSFWYHNSDTKRNINDSYGYLHNAFYLQMVTKSQKAHISNHDGLENLHNINFFWHKSQGFPEREETRRNFYLP